MVSRHDSVSPSINQEVVPATQNQSRRPTWTKESIMSIIALKWAYTQKLGNPTAKSILAFLASHNFAGDQSCFKVKTIAAATDLTIRAVQIGLKFLHEKGLVKKEARYAEHGGQLSNEYTLNVPKADVDEWYKSYGEPPVDNLGGGVHLMQGGGAPDAGGGVNQVHPLNNNKYNNNINKKLLSKDEQKKHKAVNNLKIKENFREDNQKKHDFADSMNQMASEKRHIQESEQHKRAAMPDELRDKIKKIKTLGAMIA
jgi:DNA-binding transcriptional ArsR family regulator